MKLHPITEIDCATCVRERMPAPARLAPLVPINQTVGAALRQQTRAPMVIDYLNEFVQSNRVLLLSVGGEEIKLWISYIEELAESNSLDLRTSSELAKKKCATSS